jgi:hypothetical protein
MDIITAKQAKDKTLKQYFTGKPCPNNHVAPRWVSTHICSQCTAERAKDWRKQNPKHRQAYHLKWNSENKDKVKQHNKKQQPKSRVRAYNKRHENVLRYLVYQAKARAKKIDVPFNITPNDIVMPTHCPVLGIKFEIGVGRQIDASATLDRIIPSKGYVRGNVQVISAKANRMKNDASLEDINKLVVFMKRVIVDLQ